MRLSAMDHLPAAAMAYAAGAHIAKGQRRKYNSEPYIAHPARVVEILKSAGIVDPEVLAAAWLHDVVEDTDATIEDIEQFFTPRVAQLVDEVTDVSRPEDGNRARRKEIDRQHLAQASPDGKSIKLADLIDNTSDICANDPNFARIYMREKHALLEVLGDGHPILFARASRFVTEYIATKAA